MSAEWVTLIVAVLTIISNVAISYFSNRKTTQLTLYRLQELEKKQDIHNKVIERTYKLEQDVAVLKTEVKDLKEDK